MADANLTKTQYREVTFLKYQQKQCDTLPKKTFFCYNLVTLLGPTPTRTRTIALDPTFAPFTLLKIDFTLNEPVYLMKMFKLFILKRVFSLFRMWT
jgi:hypothetical protein